MIEKFICEVIREALEDMEKNPQDSISEIWNEKFKFYDVPLKMRNGSFIVDKYVY